MTYRSAAGLACAGIVSLVVLMTPFAAKAQEQDCEGGTNCVLQTIPGLNTEGMTALPMEPITGDGFSISVDGAPVTGAANYADQQRVSDIALSDNDIDVRFDGLGIRPRLDVQTVGQGPFSAGQTVEFRNRMNYPASVVGGELRILDLDAPGGIRTLSVVPLAPNADVSVTLPQGKTLAYVYRVRDPSARYDETRPVLLGTSDNRGLTDLATEEQGSDNAAIRNIPVNGGAVTVYVQNLPPGASVETLGTTITPDGTGKAVIQRVLPVGTTSVDVRVVQPNGAAQDFTRDITIPKSEWFYVGTADLTFGRNSSGADDGGAETYNSGRLSGYAKGTTAGGYKITVQADSGEDDVDQLFSNILNKDPSSILNRLDPDLAYPTYGDNSDLVVDAPTSGGFYLKVEKNGNYGLWGDFKSENTGTELLRNERTLYGAQTVLQTQQTNSEGSPRLRFEGYAAQPDQLPQRDVLRGTGGSVYFLTKQDILVGSETLTVELRDGNTQRVISRTTLVQGQDYDINYTQGVVTLYSPLSGYGSSGALLSANPNGDDTLNLIAQYEWQPAVGDVDGYAYGGRLTSGIADHLQLGATVQVDDSGGSDQTAYGVDLSWQKSDRTYLKAEVARTDGPGYGYITSLNGGLTGTTTDAPDGSGTAYRIQGQAALDEIWSGGAGVVSAYFESFDAGFSSLDYQVENPELYWGFAADLPLTERVGVVLSYDHYDEDPGTRDDQGKIILSYQLSPRMTVELGYGHIDSEDPTSTDGTGTRDDVATRFTYEVSDDVKWYTFAQGSLKVTGDLDSSDRVGVGGEFRLNKDWSITGEVSGGATGMGARLLFGQDKGDDANTYFGYTLDPDRTIDDVVLTGQDRGQFVGGGRRRYSDSVTGYAENTYDLFGQQTSLTSTYGVEYKATERTTYSGAVETGIVTGDPDGDTDRTSVSIGVRHDNGDALNIRSRLEVINDNSTEGNVNTYLLTGLLRYELTDEARIVADVDAMFNDTASESLPQGNYLDLNVGYAFRPILDDRLNILAKYQYLNNQVDQLIDDKGNTEPLQKSHVFSIDAEYDITQKWTIGGKLGGRFGQSASTSDDPFVTNDAWLVVANARYHLVHEWDILIEGRNLTTIQGGTSDFGTVIGVYKQVGEHIMVGGSYNFGNFSDDLTDLNHDDQGAQINVIAKF